MLSTPLLTKPFIYGLEHGVRGSAQAGAYVEQYTDKKTGIPVYSLHEKTKKPRPEMLSNVDVLLFDIQDMETRFYTYIYTMALTMEAAKENNISIIILDRPNQISGTKVEGPVPRISTLRSSVNIQFLSATE